MTGLDKIIDSILAEAKERAREILEAAQADCRKTAEEYAARAENIRVAAAEKTEKEGGSLVLRAKSASAMERRNLLLKTRGALLDEAFLKAKKEMRDTDFGKYRELLTALLSSALIEAAETEKRSLALGDEVESFDKFEVLMNAKDREAYGEAVVETARRTVSRRIGGERAAKLVLAEETVEIDGGLVLRYGDIEANCSLSMLFEEIRGSLEQKVADILFH